MYNLISVHRMSTPSNFASFFALKLHPIELQHHNVGCLVSFSDFYVLLKLFGLLETHWRSHPIKPRLEGVWKKPLNKTMMFLQFLVIAPPFFMYIVNKIPIRL